ncbi:transcription factor TFIIIB component B'' homolog [Ctenodactylus gundi]
MFRRARLSVKPNVRPGAGARGSSAPNPQRGLDSPRPPEPAPEPAPKPAEPTDVPSEDPGGAGPREKAPRGSDEKTGGENNVDESIKSSSTVTQRRKRVVSASSAVRPTGNVPSQSHPLPAVNEDSPEPKPSTAKEKQPYSDRYRIYKAQKLREMLKEELRKEKKQWKNKYGINESQRPVDRSKMTMRDFIYYLPESNPMASSLEQEKKTEKSLNPVQTREQESKSTPDTEDHSEVEEAGEGPLLVPRVKVAEDGSIILDEESLTVEVLRTKGPCVVEENDPIFERGSTTTYSSFRKNYYSKPWSNKETDMFFLAISMVGTDFSMIGQLFPHRARIEIKNKFKREEKTNGWRIDKAFQEKRPFDFDFFAHLLQKVLNEEEKRKQKSAKNLSSKERKSPRPRKNVKVKNVPSEVVTDDPDECMSARTPDTEISTEDTQMVTEEECVTLSGQSSEEVPLEQDPNQKKRRRKKVQDDANEQDVNLLENVTVQLGPSEGEKHQKKDKMNTSDICGMENTERENPEAEIVSKLSEKSSLVEDSQPKVLRPARLTRGRLQRPKPNTGKVAERKDMITSQESVGVSREEDHNEFCVDKENDGSDVQVGLCTCAEGKMTAEKELADLLHNLKTSSQISELDKTEDQRTQPPVVTEKFSDTNLSRSLPQEQKTPEVKPAPFVRSRFKRPKPNLARAASRKGTHKINTFQEEMKESVTLTAPPARGRLQRPKPNVRHARQRQVVGERGTTGVSKDERTVLPDDTIEKSLAMNRDHPQLFKESNCPKIALDRRPASASRGEVGPSERRAQRKVKPSVTKARGCKRARVKASKKEPRAPRSVLVTLRASQEEEYDDAEDFVSDYEEESYHLAPEEVNKAPVFVPLGLRSPEPVSAQIEETMEELEITENVADMGCVAVVEPLLSNTNVPSQETQQEKASHTSFEVTTGEQSRDEPGTSDGSAEAAIALLTMGDLVLQSEASTEQSNGVCIFPDVHSKDKSHIPFSPDNVSHKIAHECLELSSPVINTSPASLEVNKIVSEEQNAREEVGLKEEREIEISASKATELEDKNLGPVMAAESKEQSRLAHAHDARDTSISQEANTPESSEYQEEKSQEIQTLPPAAVVSSETGPPVLASGGGVDERSVAESLMEASETDGVLTLHVPECTPASILEVQQENVADPRGLAVNLFADVQPDGEDEQAFILTLVEIPVSAAEEFAGDSSQLAPSPFLPAPILVKSANTEEKGDTSVTLPVTSVGHDALCLSNSESAGSENPPADFDLISRKRFLSRLDGSSHVPPVKRSVVASRDDRSTNTTSGPQKEQLESPFQHIGSRSLDKGIDTCLEKNVSQLLQDGAIASGKEERKDAASESAQVGSRTAPSRPPLSRPGRRPLGFLSLICSKSSLESDEPTQTQSKYRLKPLIPASRRNLKRTHPLSEKQKKTQESSGVLPSPGAASPPAEGTGRPVAQVPEPLLKKQRKGGQNRALESDELTTVSEHFFSDIFIEVEEAE